MKEDLGSTAAAVPLPLLPCPFCGWNKNKPEIDTDNRWWHVECQLCGVQTDGVASEEDALAEWNRRAHSPSLREALFAVHAFLMANYSNSPKRSQVVELGLKIKAALAEGNAAAPKAEG